MGSSFWGVLSCKSLRADVLSGAESLMSLTKCHDSELDRYSRFRMEVWGVSLWRKGSDGFGNMGLRVAKNFPKLAGVLLPLSASTGGSSDQCLPIVCGIVRINTPSKQKHYTTVLSQRVNLFLLCCFRAATSRSLGEGNRQVRHICRTWEPIMLHLYGELCLTLVGSYA